MENETIISKNEQGLPVTQKDIEYWQECAEKDDFSEFEDVSECVYGEVAPLSEEKGTISFTLPVSTIEELDNLACKQNCSKSSLLRAFVFDGLLRASVS